MLIVPPEPIPKSPGALLVRVLNSEMASTEGVPRSLAGQGLEFGDGVDRGHHGHAASAATVVVLASVDHPDVVLLALAVEADVGAAGHRYWQVKIGQVGGRPRRENGEGRHVPAVNGQVGHLRAGDQVADLCRIGLDFYNVGGHRYAFGDLADLQDCVDAHGVVRVERDAGARVEIGRAHV